MTTHSLFPVLVPLGRLNDDNDHGLVNHNDVDHDNCPIIQDTGLEENHTMLMDVAVNIDIIPKNDRGPVIENNLIPRNTRYRCGSRTPDPARV